MSLNKKIILSNNIINARKYVLQQAINNNPFFNYEEKTPQMIVQSLLDDETNVKIFLDSATRLFKSLNIPIVIEGVETEKQLSLSKEKQIDYIQGYYFSKPLKEPDLLEFLKKNNA